MNAVYIGMDLIGAAAGRMEVTEGQFWNGHGPCVPDDGRPRSLRACNTNNHKERLSVSSFGRLQVGTASVGYSIQE